MDFDLSKVDLDTAPETKFLSVQKAESLSAVEQFWFDSLINGWLMGALGETGWPKHVSNKEISYSLKQYYNDRNIRGWIPTYKKLSKILRCLFPKVTVERIQKEGVRDRYYVLPPLDECRLSFSNSTGVKQNWTENDIDA
jgi:hypothetical protein